MLLVSGWLMFRPERACSTDKKLEQACNSAFKWNTRIYWSSVVIWSIGFFAAYMLLPIRIYFDL